MKSGIIRLLVGAGVVASLAVNAFAQFSGAYRIDWDNDGSVMADPAPLYLGSNAPVALSPGAPDTAGDGYLVQLVALWGGTNFVLASATVGDNPAWIQEGMGLEPDGYFEVESTIQSNVLAQVYGTGTTPLGVKFYAGTTTAAPSALVYNNSITVPSPYYVTPPISPVYFELDYSDANFVGPRTAAGEPPGFYVIPEPSTWLLVGLGLLGAVGLARRRRG